MKEIRPQRAGDHLASPAHPVCHAVIHTAEVNLPSSSPRMAASRCPLCGEPNDCQLCTTTVYKGPCWCASVRITDELLARVPPDARNRACLCRACVANVPLEERVTRPDATQFLPEDFYLAANGRLVFTAAYHLRRGFCCSNACRHCPYPRATS